MKALSYKGIQTILLVLLFLFSFSDNIAQQRRSNQTIQIPLVWQKFNSMLYSINQKPISDQIAELKLFVKRFPDFTPSYEKLLEISLFSGEIDSAKLFFEKLSKDKAFKQNSFWMLAKVWLVKNRPDSVCVNYINSLKAGYPSLQLLQNIIQFHYLHRNKNYAIIEALKNQDLNFSIEKITDIFLSFFELKNEETIKKIQQLPDTTKGQILLLHLCAISNFRMSEYQRADSLWKSCIKKAIDLDDLSMKAEFLGNIGLIANRLSQYDLAFSYYDSAYSIAKDVLDYKRMLMINRYRGFLYKDVGSFYKAELDFKQAINIALKIQKILNYDPLPDLYRGLSTTLYYQGCFNDAIKAIDKSEFYALQTNQILDLVWIYFDRSVIYVTLKQYELAKKMLDKAIRLADSKKLVYLSSLAKAKTGEIAMLEGHCNIAHEIFNNFIDYLENNKGLDQRAFWYERLAKSYMLEHRHLDAKKAYQRALVAAIEAESKTFEGWFFLALAQIELKLNNPNETFKNLEHPRKIAEEQNSVWLLWETYLTYGDANKQIGNLNEAIAWYDSSANLIEKVRREIKFDQLRVGFFTESSQVYDRLADCYLQKYEAQLNNAYLDSILYYKQLGQSRLLRELQVSQNKSSENEDYSRAKSTLQRTQRKVRELEQPQPTDSLLSDLETARYTLLAQKIRVASVDTNAKVAQFPPMNLLQIRQELKKRNSALWLYHISEQPFVLAVNDEQARLIELDCKPDAIAVLIDSLVAPFHNVKANAVEKTPFYAGIAHQLYKLLVQPVADATVVPNEVIIVPDKMLVNLPFEMLLTRKPEEAIYFPKDNPDYAGNFLISQLAISYSPHVPLFENSTKKAGEGSDILVMANPIDLSLPRLPGQLRAQFDWQFTPLLAAESEARDIKKINPKTRIFQRKAATERRLFDHAARSRVLHFATHAFIDTLSPDFSGLLLAAGADSVDDGLLMGYEIAELDLKNCDLVTLSACETASGKLVPGEGVLGLPRQFLAAGARAVLMTHWKVDDMFTSQLMPDFYRFYLREDNLAAVALQKAKLDVLQGRNVALNGAVNYQHPLFWASFGLYGEPESEAGFKYQILLWIFGLVFLGLLIRFIYKSRIKQ